MASIETGTSKNMPLGITSSSTMAGLTALDPFVLWKDYNCHQWETVGQYDVDTAADQE